MSHDWDDTTGIAGPPGPSEPDARGGRAYLVVVRGNNAGEIFPVDGADVVIGRAPGADIRLSDEGISRFHCKLRREAGGIALEDLTSRNGTFCNGDRVIDAVRLLVEGDKVQVGTTTVLRFTYDESIDLADDDALPAIPRAEPDPSGLRDPLTGTYLRRYFVELLQSEVRFAVRYRSPLSLLMFRIDKLPEVTASHGRPVTNALIVAFAAHIMGNIRKEDVFARFSDDDFALMSRAASPGDTFMLAQRLRASSAELSVETEQGPRRFTVSLGVATLDELQVEAGSDLLIAADTALHRALGQGGDRVVLCTPELLREPRDRRLKV